MTKVNDPKNFFKRTQVIYPSVAIMKKLPKTPPLDLPFYLTNKCIDVGENHIPGPQQTICITEACTK